MFSNIRWRWGWNIRYGKKIFNSGCEKIVLNSNFVMNKKLVEKIKSNYGAQALYVNRYKKSKK